MDYSQKTHDLIERMCRNVERSDFVLDQETAAECLLKTYDLFGLARPTKVVWHADIFDKKYQQVVDIASSARSARSAWSASSAWSAWSAWSASSARSAWSALDYDFDWFVVEHEYCENPGQVKPNENDHLYLKYSELLMQAKEHGAGYWAEADGVLHLVPTPLVKIDQQNRFHSESSPAIRWKGGNEIHFLHGVSLKKQLWQRIVEKSLPAKEVLALENIEHRMVALKYMAPEKMLKALDAKMINSSLRGNYLYQIDEVFSQTAYFLKYTDPSTGRVYVSGVDPDVGKAGNADVAMAWKFGLAPEQYEQLKNEA